VAVLVRFGDGEHGRIPTARARIMARTYRYGGGPAGNLGAGLITAPQTRLTGIVQVTNPRAAAGGRAEQSVDDLKASAPHLLRTQRRAVSAQDFARLAEEAGGVRRATAVPLAHPAHPGVEVPGAVTVVIVPEDGDLPPKPSADLRERVAAFLEPFRLITTELSVTGPHYRKVSVTAVVRTDPAVAGGTVQREVLAALGRHLDPDERAFGADLAPTMLYGVIQEVPSVRDVRSLRIDVAGQPREITEQITAGPGDLFYGADHEITVQPFVDR
jgi:predicted phage baseplate assembly protein